MVGADRSSVTDCVRHRGVASLPPPCLSDPGLFSVAREGVVLRYAASDAVSPETFSRAANVPYTQGEVRAGQQHGGQL